MTKRILIPLASAFIALGSTAGVAQAKHGADDGAKHKRHHQHERERHHHHGVHHR